MTPTERFADDEPTPMTESVFGRVLVGVDGTGPGFEACRQTAILAEPDAAIEAVSVVHLSDAVQVGLAAQRAADKPRRGGRRSARRGGPHPRHARRHAVPERLRDRGDPARDRRVRGDRRRDRLARAPARDRDPDRRRRGRAAPRRAVLGPRRAAAPRTRRVPALDRRRHRRLARVDAAFRAGERLAGRASACRLETIVSSHGKGVDVAKVHLRAPFARVRRRASGGGVAPRRRPGPPRGGSRGLHGVKALGSVSERVAHRAACSVLVVRGEA